MTRCEDCQQFFSTDPNSFARKVEADFPDCECEQYSVGIGSPGRIEDAEILYRVFTDPVDVDDGRIARAAFNDALESGLSIIRDCATNVQVEDLVKDILSVKPDKKRKTVLAIFRVNCVSFRHFRAMFRGHLGKSFCVYDQTVSRTLAPEEPPVPTHGIVLSRRLFEAPITKRQFENSCNDTLHRLITVNKIAIEDFRQGLIVDLNARSLKGEFVRASTH